MITLLYGFLVGRYASNYKRGLVVLLIPVVLFAIIVAQVSYRDGAGLLMPLWGLIGFAFGRVVNWYFERRKGYSEDIGTSNK